MAGSFQPRKLKVGGGRSSADILDEGADILCEGAAALLLGDVTGLRVGNEVAILDQRREGRTGDALPQRLADPLTDRVVVVAERLAVLGRVEGVGRMGGGNEVVNSQPPEPHHRRLAVCRLSFVLPLGYVVTWLLGPSCVVEWEGGQVFFFLVFF